MKSKFLKKSRVNSEDMSLNITSMADIFTIILVFLLKSYATSAVNVTPAKGMLLPQAVAGEAPVEALKVEITSDAVSVEGVPIVTLTGFQFGGGEMQGNGTSKRLAETFSKERQRQLLIAKSNSDVKVDAKMVVVADQRAPYDTIKAVLASGAVHGYTDFKLAVVTE